VSFRPCFHPLFMLLRSRLRDRARGPPRSARALNANAANATGRAGEIRSLRAKAPVGGGRSARGG
jgi:hypothetical protein